MGKPFCQGEFPGALWFVELALGADLTADPATWSWTDVTADILTAEGRGVDIRVGKGANSKTAQSAQATLALLNPDARYSAYNPMGPNWPNVRENTPLRVRLYLGGQYYTRFQGEAKAFKPGWDVSGRYSIVDVTANGILNRLEQGSKPLHSALYRAVGRYSPLPIAWWSLEDGADSTYAASALPDGGPMFPTGKASFGTGGGVPGSAPLPVFSGGYRLVGTVPRGSNSTEWAVAFVVQIASNAGTDTDDELATFTTSTSDDWLVALDIDASQWQLIYDPGGGASTTLAALDFATYGDAFDGQPHTVAITAIKSGSNINWAFYVNNSGTSGTIVGQTLGRLIQASVGEEDCTNPIAIGHVAVWDDSAVTGSALLTAASGYAGSETPAQRINRLCAEDGVPISWVGTTSSSVVMGPQSIDTFVGLLRECEISDAGFLYDGLSAGLSYQALRARYNATAALVLDATAGEVQPPFEPDMLDQLRVNSATVQSKGGAAVTFEDADGPLGTATVGVYDSSLSPQPNFSDDGQSASRASWEVHAGTVFGLRYPQLRLNLRRIPAKAAAWAALTPGSLITVTPPYAAQHPAGDLSLVVEGWEEHLSRTAWEVGAINCSPGQTYEVFKLGDSRLGRLGGDASSLSADASAGATSLTVATTAGSQPWITTAANASMFPFDVEISGIKVTVTGITGAASPQTFTVTGATVTKALYSGDSVKLWRPGVLKL